MLWKERDFATRLERVQSMEETKRGNGMRKALLLTLSGRTEEANFIMQRAKPGIERRHTHHTGHSPDMSEHWRLELAHWCGGHSSAKEGDEK